MSNYILGKKFLFQTSQMSNMSNIGQNMSNTAISQQTDYVQDCFWCQNYCQVVSKQGISCHIYVVKYLLSIERSANEASAVKYLL